MTAFRLALRNLVRDLKSGEIAVLLVALAVAVAALTAVGFFTSRVSRAVNQQAGEVLAADLRLESARPIDESYDREAAKRGLAVARILSMPSVVFHGEDSSLVTLRAASPGYPLRGRLKVADRPFGPARATDAIPAPRRGLGGFAPAGETRRGAGLRARGGRRKAPRHARPRLPAGPGRRLRRPVGDAAHQHGRRACDAAHPARQPREPRGALRRRGASDRRLPRLARVRETQGRAPAVRGRHESADPRFVRPRGPFPVAREHGERAALGGCRGHGRTALCAASSRRGGAHEVHGRLAGLRAAAVARTALRHRDRGRGGGDAGGLSRADRTRVAAARPHERRAAATRRGRGVARSRNCGRDPGRVRAAAAAAAPARAAGARAAARPRAAAAAIRRRVRTRGRLGAGAALLAGARRAAGGLGRGRHRCDVRRARPRGMGAGAGARSVAPRRRRRLALRAREHRAPRARQRRAGRGLRPRDHGAAAARAGAGRPSP